MEVTITPIRRRSLLRRVAPWALSLGLFASGGAGLFHYATRTKAEDPAAAAKAAAASDRARRLFGDDVASTAPRNAPSESPVDASADERYGVTTTAYAATAAPASESPSPSAATPINPFGGAASPAPAGGDRYTAAAASSTPAGAPDVARGQDDSADNPLRAPGAAAAIAAAADALATESPETARNAFREPAPAAAAPPAPAGTGRYGANVEQDFANAFSQPASQPAQSDGAVSAAPAQSAPQPAIADEADPAAQPLTAAQMAPTHAPLPQAASPPAPAATSAYAADDARALSPPPQEVANPYLASTAAPTGEQPAGAYGADSDPGLTPTPGIQTAEGTGRPGERGLEGAQSPTLAIQKLGPAEIQVGKKCTFAVRVKNVGQRTAHGVAIHDQIPQGTKLVGTAPRASVAGADVAWDLGTLSAGEERLVEMELIPTEEGELGSVATVTFAAQASARARCTRPQLALRLAASPRVMIGERQIVQVEVSNPGTGDATGVMILENVPAAVTHEAGPSLEYEIGTLRAGQSKTIDLVLTAAQAGTVQNVMVARADANLEVQAACEFEILAPGLKLSVDGPQMRYLERPAKYTVSVENPGTAAAHDVQLVSHLPKGLKFVSANNLGEYDAATHSVYWSLAELPANERGAVELVALPVEAGDHAIKTSTEAAQGLKDEAETRVRVEGLAALTVEVSDLEDLIEVGGKTTYEIRVINQGSKAATNVQIAAALTPGMRVLAAEGEARHTVQGSQVTFSPLAQLPPRGESVFRVTVQATGPGDQRLRVQVAADDLQQPIAEEESTRVYADQ